MEQKNQPINQNPTSNNQGENIASSSGNNPTKISKKNKGKEVEKITVSEELLTMKDRIGKVDFAVITDEKIKKSLERENKDFVFQEKANKDEKISISAGLVLSNIPVFGMIGNIENMKTLEKVAKRAVIERGEMVVKKLVNKASLNWQREKKVTMENLEELSEQVSDREQGLLTKISELSGEIGRMENKLDEYKKKEMELAERAKERVKKGRTLDSKAIVDLKQAKERINELETENIELEQNRDEWKDLYDGRNIEINDLNKKVELEEEKTQNAIKSAETLDERLKKERAKMHDLNAELDKLKIETIPNLKIDLEALEKKNKEQADRLKDLEPSYFYQICDNFGIIKIKNLAVNACVVVGLIALLYAFSLILKYLVKPTIKNVQGVFKGKKRKRITEEIDEDDSDEEENIIDILPDKKLNGSDKEKFSCEHCRNVKPSNTKRKKAKPPE